MGFELYNPTLWSTSRFQGYSDKLFFFVSFGVCGVNGKMYKTRIRSVLVLGMSLDKYDPQKFDIGRICSLTQLLETLDT